MQEITYGFIETPFGCGALLAWTAKGALALDFLIAKPAAMDLPPAAITPEEAFSRFRGRYAQDASFIRDDKAAGASGVYIFDKNNAVELWGEGRKVKVDLTGGTSLQTAVWNALAQIPLGALVSYSDLAVKAGYPRAVRAVSSAVGQNPLSYILPCHRVVHSGPLKLSTERFGWGTQMKVKMLQWEGAAI